MARRGAGDVTASLSIAREFGERLSARPHREIVGALAGLAAGDLTVARVVEPHLDALVIHREAGLAGALPGIWGVFAAEDPRYFLNATNEGARWSLAGTKPWCSLAGRLDHCLVTATTPAGQRLFSVDLGDARVRVHPVGTWVSQGLPAITSVPIDLDRITAEPIGGDNWYLSRPGFAWGGIRVAAVWLGALTALVTQLRDTVARRHADDRLRLYNLGQADLAAWEAGLAVAHAADAIDRDYDMTAIAARRLAERTRAAVADAAATVLTQVGHALGPAPLAFDTEYASRTADLNLYVRQHHAERDLAMLGANLLEDRPAAE
jgi:alkylation response protein AidB-like acyl-CoA dehydrogenase